jgi:hypothetical protein
VNHLVGEEPRSPIDCDSLLVKQIEQNAQRINIPQVKAIWIIWDRCPFDGSKPSDSVRKCWYTVYPKLKLWFLNVKFAQFIIAKNHVIAVPYLSTKTYGSYGYGPKPWYLPILP